MSTLSDLVKILQPLNLYSLTKSSNVYRELSVYGKEFDRLKADFDEFLRECFVQTAETYGLSNIEHIYMNPTTELDAETRRQRILDRLLINDSDYTLQAVSKAIKCFGTESFDIIEFPNRNQVVVEIFGEYTQAQEEYIVTEITKLLPADNVFQVNFDGLTWSDFEAENLTFAEIEAKNYDWKTIDKQKLT